MFVLVIRCVFGCPWTMDCVCFMHRIRLFNYWVLQYKTYTMWSNKTDWASHVGSRGSLNVYLVSN